MQRSSLSIIIALLVAASVCAFPTFPYGEHKCNFALKVRSVTKKPFQLQIFIPSLKQMTERVTFEGMGEKKVQVGCNMTRVFESLDLQIIGKNCSAQKWLVKTWKREANGEWVGAAQTAGKLSGDGKNHFIRLYIEDNLMPSAVERMGVTCSEGGNC